MAIIAKNNGASPVTVTDLSLEIGASSQVDLLALTPTATAANRARRSSDLRALADPPSGPPSLVINDGIADLPQSEVRKFLKSATTARATLTGTYTGTGATLDVTLAFKPRMVEIFGLTTASRSVKTIDMASDTYVQHVGASISVVASGNGIRLRNTGFRVGTEAAINTLGDSYCYIVVE